MNEAARKNQASLPPSTGGSEENSCVLVRSTSSAGEDPSSRARNSIDVELIIDEVGCLLFCLLSEEWGVVFFSIYPMYYASRCQMRP